jgi:hypothetical protein
MILKETKTQLSQFIRETFRNEYSNYNNNFNMFITLENISKWNNVVGMVYVEVLYDA